MPPVMIPPIKRLDPEDRRLIDEWLATHDVMQIPIGITALVNNVPKRQKWGGKKPEEEPVPTFVEEEVQPKPHQRGRPRNKKDEREENIIVDG